MPAVRSKTTAVALLVGAVALALVTFGIVALESALHNAEAAATAEARRAAFAAVRELRSRVLHPAFVDRLPGDEGFVLDRHAFRSPRALPQRSPVHDIDFVTRATLDLARKHEFVNHEPAMALARVDEAILRGDRAAADLGVLLTTAMWICERQGNSSRARAYRRRVKSFDAMPPDAIARTLLFDAMLADRARVIRPVIVVSPQTFAVESHGAKSIPGPVTRAQTPSPSPNPPRQPSSAPTRGSRAEQQASSTQSEGGLQPIPVDAPAWASMREVVRALVTSGDDELVHDTIASLRTYATTDAITEHVEASHERIKFLRSAAELLENERPRLVAAGEAVVEHVVLEPASSGTTGAPRSATGRAVLLYYPGTQLPAMRVSTAQSSVARERGVEQTTAEGGGERGASVSPLRRDGTVGNASRANSSTSQFVAMKSLMDSPTTFDATGVAFVLPFEQFETLALASAFDDGVPQPSPIRRLEPRAPSSLTADVLPVFDGIIAIPFSRSSKSSNQPSRLLFVALAVLLLAGLWLLVRSYRAERLALAARGDFLRSITHELRTPLASIRLFADTLAEGRAKDEAARSEFTQLLAVEAGRLSTLVENALELGRTERGERTLHFEVARVDELVQEGVALFDPLAREAGLSVQFSGVHAVAHVDRDALRQVLWNLLDNARKYAGRGRSVFVAVSVEAATGKIVGAANTAGASATASAEPAVGPTGAARTADPTGKSPLSSGPARVVLRVCDDGPGIDTAERSRVFERFVRGKAQSHGNVPGAGLGLAIVRSIVTAHGGSVRCTTGPRDRGACFEVTLPASRSDAELDGGAA
ncbi:MAG: HAMP domain-containing histidine kinase [Planctomycetes bacterium]|nr:HAMP domain-containing histidine kinase [Planctomycetota bacterium]